MSLYAEGGRYPLSPVRRGEPLPTDDYYSTDYEPTELLAEWASLRGQCATLEQHLVQGATTGSAVAGEKASMLKRKKSPHSQSLSLPSTRAASRQPRNSLALELFFVRQKHPHALHYSRDDDRLNGGNGAATQFASSSPPRSSGPSNGSSSFSGSGAGMRSGNQRTSRQTAVRKQQRQQKECEVSAFAQTSDPYDRGREIERQAQFLRESRRLGAPFVSATGPDSGAPTRLMLGDCVRDVYKCVVRGWPRAEPMVVSTAEDLIVVYFSLHELKRKDPAAILAYMNAFAKAGEVVREFRLTRVPEGWDVLTEDGHLMYTFRPPWVRKGRRFLPDTVIPTAAHVPR